MIKAGPGALLAPPLQGALTTLDLPFQAAVSKIVFAGDFNVIRSGHITGIPKRTTQRAACLLLSANSRCGLQGRNIPVRRRNILTKNARKLPDGAKFKVTTEQNSAATEQNSNVERAIIAVRRKI